MIPNALLIVALALVLPAAAQIEFLYPTPRGPSLSQKFGITAPCGGLNETSSDRTRMSVDELTTDLFFSSNDTRAQINLGLGSNVTFFVYSSFQGDVTAQPGSPGPLGTRVITRRDLGNLELEEGQNGTVQLIAFDGNANFVDSIQKYAVRPPPFSSFNPGTNIVVAFVPTSNAR